VGRGCVRSIDSTLLRYSNPIRSKLTYVTVVYLTISFSLRISSLCFRKFNEKGAKSCPVLQFNRSMLTGSRDTCPNECA
jgi:hypothetical protein